MTTTSDSDAEALERDVAEVHPDFQQIYRMVRSMAPPVDLTTPPEVRRAAVESAAAPGVTAGMVEEVELHEVRDLEIPVDGGVIPARLYRPTDATTLPGLVHFHGGGWFLGSVEGDDNGCRLMSARMGAAVVSVGYRLAPEYKWPVAPEDCYAATMWVRDHADELGINASDVAVSGGSAGGNLAAAVALMSRDRGGPTLSAQFLMIGAFDLTLPESPSWQRYGKGFVLDRDEVALCRTWYVDDADCIHPYASPIYADVAGLPPTVVLSATCDPIYDQSVNYAAKLRDAGVDVTEIRGQGHMHGTQLLTGVSESARTYLAEAVAALARARSIAQA